MKHKIVFFDFDGVVVDTFKLSFKVASSEHPGLTVSNFRKLFEVNVHEALKKANIDEAKTSYFEAYRSLLMKQEPVRGLSSLIYELAKDAVLIIVSSTPSNLIKEYLKANDLSNSFAEVWGDDVSPSKVYKINLALDRYKVRPKDAVFITDTLGDVREANVSGVPSIAVTWGFHEEVTLSEGKPVAIVNNVDDLWTELESFGLSANS